MQPPPYPFLITSYLCCKVIIIIMHSSSFLASYPGSIHLLMVLYSTTPVVGNHTPIVVSHRVVGLVCGIVILQSILTAVLGRLVCCIDRCRDVRGYICLIC